MEGALETERLRLTPLTEADLDDLVELDLEPEVRRFIDPQGIILPVDRTELRTYEWERHVSPGGFYAARERVGNAFVGFFQLEAAPDREGEVELGYRLRRHAWGLGYATEGARALVAHAFEVLGYRRIYAHSLTLAFALLFVASFIVHAVAGARRYNGEQAVHGHAPVTVGAYLGTSQFWFESFQNWQSEFLAIAAMVVLSIFLRQKGSPESKPVDSPHRQTGG